jgi:twinkle protein
MEYRDKLRDLGITLTRSGKQTCPQCSHLRKNKTDPCLSVTYTDEAVLYKCHNCDWSGAVYYRSKFEQTKKTYKRPDAPKVVKELAPIYKYFAKRKISQKTVDLYGVSFNDKKEIVFPYYKYGELVNVKYRTNLGNGKKKFRQEKDTEKTLYGMDLVKDTDTLIWVEGEMDVLALAEQGIFAVSIPQGASENKLECIENCFDFIQQFKTHIIAVDNDVPGDKLKESLLNRIGKEKCKVVNWKQYKDADEALIGGENLKTFIDSAEDIAPDGILTFYDCFDEIYKYNFEKDSDYFETGWTKFDNLVKIRTGYMMIVSGYPSRGKSTFVDNLLMNLSKRYGLKHLIASFESVIAGHYNSLLEMYSEVAIYRYMREHDNNIFGEPFEFIADHFYRFDIDRLWTVDEIIERTELAVRKYGVKTLVIDPYNRLNNKIVNNREDLYIGSILSKLSMLAKRLNILVIFIAHPKKPDGEKMPNMYSISGSGDWYNMADYGIIVHRDRSESGKLNNLPTVFVEKVKNHFLGDTSGGEITLRYDEYKRILVNVV